MKRYRKRFAFLFVLGMIVILSACSVEKQSGENNEANSTIKTEDEPKYEKQAYRIKKRCFLVGCFFTPDRQFSLQTRLSLEGFLMCWSSTATSLLIRSSSYLHNTD